MEENEKTNLFYKKHIFCCVNKREKDSRPSCANNNSENLSKYMKKKCKSLNVENIRVNQSSCLNRCESGPVLVIYPEGIWYNYKNETDIDKIIEQHIIEGKIVQELQLSIDN